MATVSPEVIDAHAPAEWESEINRADILRLIEESSPTNMIVLAADVRQSTYLMKEATDFKQYATAIGGFVDNARTGLFQHRGWFDKFTGDGFLGYWIVGERDWHDYIPLLLGACFALVETFNSITLEELRPSLRNLPSGVGLSIGIDYGPTHFAIVGNDLTIVGPTVVGAVRMVDAAATPRDILCNVGLGSRLYAERNTLGQQSWCEITRERRPTKEYDQQEVYRIVPLANWHRYLCDWAHALQRTAPALGPGNTASQRTEAGRLIAHPKERADTDPTSQGTESPKEPGSRIA